MAFNVEALEAYTNEVKNDLISKVIFGAKSISLANIQTGIKSAETINIMDTDVLFQAGGSCGYTSSGTTSITQRKITVGKIKVNESLCYEDLEAKFTQIYLNEGANYTNPADFNQYQAYVDRKVAQVTKAMELAVWQARLANSTTNTPNVAHFDGWNEILDAASATTVNGNPDSVTAVTTANIMTVIDAMYALVPEDILSSDNLELRMGWDVFRTLQIKLRDINNFNYNGVDYAAGELMYPGTNIKVIALHGLTGTRRMYIARRDNWYYGTDLANDYEDANFRYSEDDEIFKTTIKWKAGCQVAFPEQIVRFKLA